MSLEYNLKSLSKSDLLKRYEEEVDRILVSSPEVSNEGAKVTNYFGKTENTAKIEKLLNH